MRILCNWLIRRLSCSSAPWKLFRRIISRIRSKERIMSCMGISRMLRWFMNSRGMRWASEAICCINSLNCCLSFLNSFSTRRSASSSAPMLRIFSSACSMDLCL